MKSRKEKILANSLFEESWQNLIPEHISLKGFDLSLFIHASYERQVHATFLVTLKYGLNFRLFNRVAKDIVITNLS